MKRKLCLILLFIVMLASLSSCKERQDVVGESSAQTETSSAGELMQGGYDVLPCIHYDADWFRHGMEHAAAYETDGTIRAGIIPHHSVGSRLIASFFLTLAEQKEAYDLIILVGPNHYFAGGGVVVSGCDWETPFGTLRQDDALLSELLQHKDIHAGRDDRAIQNDHSIGYLLPFIAYFQPQAKVSAVILSGLPDDAALSALAECFREAAAEQNVLILGSIDFSHYLSLDAALSNNAYTKELIARQQYGRLLTLDSGYVDSPQTLSVVMQTAALLQADPLLLLDESVSCLEVDNENGRIDREEGTTSYLVYAAMQEAEDAEP